MFSPKRTGHCPVCDGTPLIVLELGGVEVDYCTRCGGVWLDAGELDLIAEAAGAERGPLAEALEAAGGGTRGARRCPRCAKHLRVVALNDSAKTELDRCPRGHGLWFDAGELERVVASAQGAEESAVATFFADMFGERLRKKQTLPSAKAAKD